MEQGIEDVYGPGDASLGMPRRPAWDYTMSKAAVEEQEQRAFDAFLQQVHSLPDAARLGYFEHNLETWRELWRVVELSDIVLLVCDVRYPVVHFSPALYRYVHEDLGIPLIVVLNKCDLVPAQLAEAWRAYFVEHFPGLHVALFTSRPADVVVGSGGGSADGAPQWRPSRRSRRRLRAHGVRQVLEACEHLKILKRGELIQWHDLIVEQDRLAAEAARRDEAQEALRACKSAARAQRRAIKVALELGGRADAGDAGLDDAATNADAGSDASSADEDALDLRVGELAPDETARSQDFATIGILGHPNVGKSSLLNGIVGRKVVSCSRTPGHTKHFQTIFLTPKIRLCDSPGIIFPAFIPKQLQVACAPAHRRSGAG